MKSDSDSTKRVEEERRSSAGTRSSLGILGTNLLMRPLSIVVSIVVARLLGPDGKGIFTFLLLLGGTIFPLFTLGSSVGILYMTSSGRYAIKDITFTGLVMGVILGVFGAVGIGLLWVLGLLGETARSTPSRLIVPILLLMPIEGVHMVFFQLLKGGSWFSAMNVVRLATKVTTPLLLASLVIIAGMGLDGAVFAIIASKLLVTAILVIMVWWRYGTRIVLRTQFVWDSLRYGVKVIPAMFSRRVNLRLDHLFLGVFAPPAALGSYAIATQTSELVWLGNNSFSSILFNRIAQTDSVDEQTRIVGQVHRSYLPVSLLLALGLAVSAPFLIPLVYGEEFSDAVIPFLILIPGAVAMVTPKTLELFFSGSGNPERNSIIQSVGAIFSLVLYTTFVPSLGLKGAAIASSANYMLMMLFTVWLFRRTTAGGVNLFRVRTHDLVWIIRRLRGGLSVWWDSFRSFWVHKRATEEAAS